MKMMENKLQKIKEATNYIQSKANRTIDIGLILGSGLGDLVQEIQNPLFIDYKDIPHFPASTVAGHAGRLVIGSLQGKNVVAMQGRFHYYEGYSMQEITFPVYVLKQLGIKLLIVTNACGSMNPDFKAGDLMLIRDHINMMFDNPLIGYNYEELGPRFPDMSQAYSPRLQKLVLGVAEKEQITLRYGVYTAISGPSYSSPSELTMLSRLGADVVGMSTIPEVIVANHTGIEVIGISCITDMAIADELEPLTHEQVIEVANQTKPKFIKLIKAILAEDVI